MGDGVSVDSGNKHRRQNRQKWEAVKHRTQENFTLREQRPGGGAGLKYIRYR